MVVGPVGDIFGMDFNLREPEAEFFRSGNPDRIVERIFQFRGRYRVK